MIRSPGGRLAQVLSSLIGRGNGDGITIYPTAVRHGKASLGLINGLSRPHPRHTESSNGLS